MGRGRGAAANFTRGWETLSHSLQMLRLSVVLHLAISLIVGVVIGSGWFALSLQGEARRELGQYAAVSAAVEVSKWRDQVLKMKPQKQDVRAEALMKRYRKSVYGERSIAYLALQWSGRVGLVASVGVLVGALLAARRGRRIMRDRFLRGAALVDRRSAGRSGWRVLAAFGVAACCSGGLGLLVMPSGVWEFGWATLLHGWPDLAAVFTPPNFEPATAWFGHPLEAGFYSVEDVYTQFRANVFGVSFATLLCCWLLATAVLAGGWMTLAGGPKRRPRSSSSEPAGDLELASVRVPRDSECEHMLFTGSPGAGKSTAIKKILGQVRARREPAIVLDVSGEYIERFYRPGKDKILNPLDQRSEAWTLWADADESVGYTEMARSLFPGKGRDAFWSDAATTVFAAAAETLAREGRPTNAAFHQMLTCASLSELVETLQGTPAERLLSGDNGPMPLSVMATVTSKLGAWSWMPDPAPDAKPFSIRSFVEEPGDSWLFLAVRENKREALRPLISLWYDIAANAILSLPDSHDRRIWCVLDEVAALQRLPALPHLMARGRKKGVPVVLGLQSISQLRESYGRDGAATLAAMPQTWLVLRTVEPETAQWLEEALGHAEVEEARASVSMGTEAARDGVSISHNLSKRPVVLASEITRLPDMNGYLKQPGQRDVWRVSYTYDAAADTQPAFIPRPSKTKAAG